MEILGKHKQSFALIRSLAIMCHALDVSAHRLFVHSTYEGKSDLVKEAYDELLSTKLLQLAIAIRINIYQNPDINKDTDDFMSPCGILDIGEGENQRSSEFSIKDVCNKIIHATEIFREIEPRDVSTKCETVTILRGICKNEKWDLGISINMFCESILNWLDELSYGS